MRYFICCLIGIIAILFSENKNLKNKIKSLTQNVKDFCPSCGYNLTQKVVKTNVSSVKKEE